MSSPSVRRAGVRRAARRGRTGVAPSVLALAGALALLGCETGGGDATLFPDGALRFSAPPMLGVRAVNPNNLRPRVRVNGRSVQPEAVDGEFTARATVPEGEDVRVSITWFERIARNGGVVDLPLAAIDFTIEAIGRDEQRTVEADDYDADGFDLDGDGQSNLAERNANTSPFDPDDPGEGFAQVLLPRVEPIDSPIIDGLYDPIWDFAQYRDRDNDLLLIDNLMIDFGATRLDQESGYRWGALHDGEALYLIAFVEAGADQTPFGDSEAAFNDDSIDVYVDGDDSSLSSYDDVDDRHLILPLLGSGGGANSSQRADARIDVGPNSAPFDPRAVTFATCPCPGEVQIYELRLPLDDFDIVVDETFGFEVHVNDDKDGGTRDVKWGWWHPSRVNENVDYTFVNPTFMGTARLLP